MTRENRHVNKYFSLRLLRLFTVLVLLLFTICSYGDKAMADDGCLPLKGWFIRINPGQTEAPGVKFEIGFGGVESSHTNWREWRHGQPHEFSVPVQFIRAEEIWIKGTSLEEDRDVSMCVGFDDHITQKMCFDEDEEHETSRGDNDGCGC
ncbi:MAG: hypothetical protein ACKVQW_06060 [Pyrinomonadaceae bacterium]